RRAGRGAAQGRAGRGRGDRREEMSKTAKESGETGISPLSFCIPAVYNDLIQVEQRFGGEQYEGRNAYDRVSVSGMP
ncbi:MAG: hypothetical protein PUC62_02985, partial [Oscillospiraceae bacterium]|nr:hypothetical protein [Oscillospiraceae bacterium]